MLPKIRQGYPVRIHGQTFTRVGIVCDVSTYASDGTLQVVYMDQAFTARRTTVVWRETRFEWADPASPGESVENDPTLAPYATTLRNGRY